MDEARLVRERPRRRSPGLALAAVVGLVVAAPHARADAPPCRYEILGDLVRDKQTTLVWERGQSTSNRTWAEASDRCAELQLKGDGWRVPSIHELQTLVDLRKVLAQGGASTDEAAFPTTTPDNFWSSTRSARDQNAAWIVSFSTGDVGQVSVNALHPLRCVR